MIDSNELTRKIKTPLNPRAALIAYASENDRNFFLEIREIDDRGNITEGRPVTLEFMNTLVKGYSERHSTTPYGKIPDNLLYCDPRKGSERYVWYNPPHKRMMFFSPALKMENAEYYLPGVIYEAGEHGMRIYAYKGNVPDPDTELYAAPFFNVTGSSVCLGNRQDRTAEGPDLRKAAPVLGEEILADGIHTLGKQREPDKIKPRTGDKGGTGQRLQPGRTQTAEQHET